MESKKSGPFHKQILQEIRSNITEGIWKYGDRIPSERELCNKFGVSRITVRQALRSASELGIIESHPGKGTFVSKRKVGKGVIENTTFSDLIRGLGKEPKSQILNCRTISSSLKPANLLELFGDKDLINLVILGLGNDEPLIIYSSFFAHDLGIILVERARARISKGIPFSSFDLYSDGPGILPEKAYQTFEVAQAVSETAHILKVPLKSPLFVIKSVFYSRNDTPIEYREAKYNGDRFVFRIKREF